MQPPAIRDEVLAFHRQQVVVDLHVDVIIQRRLFGYDMRKRHRPWMRRQPFIRHADVPRMLDGGYSAAVLGLHYWPWESRRGWREIRKQLAYMERVLGSDDRVVAASSAADIEAAQAAGKLALLAGIEGAHILAGDLAHLEEARQRGVVYVTLAHFSKNAACTPGMGRGRNQRDGLTAFGRDLVARLNELQILVDVAHVNQPGVIDACQASRAPVVATHSSAIALKKNQRGLSDDGIRAVAATGGVIGVIFAPIFLRGRLDAPSDAMVEHVLHIAELVGPQHVALGSDFDGWIPTIPNDMRDCRDLPLLTQKLLDAGLSQPDVAGILGANFLRVLREVRGR